jgi:hypothetical protein
MYHSGNNNQQVPVKTINLSINPAIPAFNNIPTNIVSNPVIPIHAVATQTPLPDFNHVPIYPTIAHAPKRVTQLTALTAEEREARRAAQQRERSARYQEKIKEYKKIGTLKTEKEKIIRVLLLCYPSLEEMDPVELDNKINQFMRSLGII